MQPVALASVARLFIVLHALSAMALLGASTHAAIGAIAAWRGSIRPRLARIYAIVVAGTYTSTVVLGALAYPSYRYYVRGLYLDRYATWASNLFDIKESFAALGLPLAVAALVLRLRTDPDAHRELRLLSSFFVLGTTAIVWFATISGLVVALERAP